MSDDQNPFEDPFDELLRRSLADEASKVEPGDGLHRIQARLRAQRRQSPGRRPWALTIGGAVVGAAAAVGLFAVLTDDNDPGTSPEVAAPVTTTTGTPEPRPTVGRSPLPSILPTTAPSSKPSRPTGTATARTQPPASTKATGGTPEAAVTKAVSVYWIGKTVGNDTGAGERLYRTFVRITGRPAYEAVRTMTTQKAADPDYGSAWTGAEVSSVTRTGSLIVVDFKTLPRRTLEPAAADLAVQQLVYTVQGALGDDSRPVQITAQGTSAGTLFGVVDTSKPISRAQAADVQALVWINSPAEGAVANGPVAVTGVAAAFEAQVNWRALNLRTKAVVSGFTLTEEGQKFSPFAFTANLGAGKWLLEAYLVSPQDGRITDTDSKRIVVK